MNRARLVQSVLALVAAGVASSGFAQQPLEIIALRHRSAEQVLPSLQPLLEPGGTLSGTRGQLFLRTSPANAGEIKRALAALDQPLRRLVISVRVGESMARERRDVAVSGNIGREGGRVGISAEDSRRARDERVDQRIQVLEGGRAFVATGRSSAFHDTRSGFEVIPRLSGSTVHLEVAQQRPGQALATAVAARLGEWVELGAVTQSAEAPGMRAAESSRVWVKVEELAN